MTSPGTDLHGAVGAFVALPKVLVAVDFDGTLSPFVLNPLQARALPGGVEALRAAAGLTGVSVAVVSGRDLATLESITGIGPDDAITLIGSHGAEINLIDHANPPPGAGFLDQDATARLSLVNDELAAIKARYPAVRLELKPSAVVLHTRGVDPSQGAAASAAAREVADRHPGVHVMPGKNVVELTVLEANKGNALLKLARETGSDATLYVGDDVTDEQAFAALDPASGDLSVKVGDGDTVASQRVPDQACVVELLQLFVSCRRAEERRTQN
jgi:trehalose 6-phosphate phosphatase